MGLCTESAVLLAPIMGGLGASVEAGGFSMFSLLLRGVDPGALNGLLLRAVEVAKLSCAGQPICDVASFERHFDEHRQDLYQVCFWTLWECVRDFLPDLSALSRVLPERMRAAASQFLKDGVPTTGSGVPSGSGCAPGGTCATGP